MVNKSIKKNTIYNAIRTCVTLLFPVITLPYVNRVLTVDYVGKISFSSSIVSFFGLIASLGISTYAIRECSAIRDDKSAFNELASQVFSINLLMTVFSYMILFGLLCLSSKLSNYRVIILLQSLSIISNTLGADWINESMEDFRFISLRTCLFQLLSLILLFVLVHKPEDYLTYTFIGLISSSGASIINIWYRRKTWRVRFVGKMEWKKHFVAILFLFAMILFQTLFTSVDIIMLGYICGDHEVGIYSVASKMSLFIAQGIDSIVFVIMPRMSLYFSGRDYHNMSILLKKTLGVLVAVGLPCSTGCAFLSKNIIMIIAGQSYSESASVLSILSVGVFFLILGGGFLGNCILLPCKREKEFTFALGFSVVVNALLNYLLIPQWGSKAAAITSVLSSVVLFVALIRFVDKRIVLDQLTSVFFGPCLGSIGVACICVLLRSVDNIWASSTMSIVGSIVLYAIILYLCRCEIFMEGILWMKKAIVRSQ